MNTLKLTSTLISLLFITGCATQQQSQGLLKLPKFHHALQTPVTGNCRAGSIEFCEVQPAGNSASRGQVKSCTCVFPEVFRQSPARRRR